MPVCSIFRPKRNSKQLVSIVEQDVNKFIEMSGLCCIPIYFIRFYVAVGCMLFSLMRGVYVVQFDVAMGFMLFGLMPPWGYVVGFDVTVGFMLFGLMTPADKFCKCHLY